MSTLLLAQARPMISWIIWLVLGFQGLEVAWRSWFSYEVVPWMFQNLPWQMPREKEFFLPHFLYYKLLRMTCEWSKLQRLSYRKRTVWQLGLNHCAKVIVTSLILASFFSYENGNQTLATGVNLHFLPASSKLSSSWWNVLTNKWGWSWLFLIVAFQP